MITALVLSALVLIGWSYFSDWYFPKPKPAATAPAASGPIVPSAPASAAAPVIKPVTAALGETARIAIETPSVKGSIALKGARLDDLVLVRHKETIKKDSPDVRLLSPAGTKRAYFASFGWIGDGFAVPDANTIWAANGTKLTPETPVTLSWTNPTGQQFAIKLSVDKNYLFSAAQTVTNAGGTPIAVRPFSMIDRSFGANKNSSMFSHNVDVDAYTMHVGPLGDLNGRVDFYTDFGTLDEAGAAGKQFDKGGWIGFGDTYWLTALVPSKDAKINVGFLKDGDTYRAYFGESQSNLAPGGTLTTSTRLFAGAKEVAILNDYEENAGIPRLSNAIDWGWFEIIEKPIFKLLSFLFKMTNNFGVAIILLTFVVRGLMFPIAQRQFASMAAMRAVQPKMKELQERYKDDKPKLQQEMMALYSKEKINPMAGCLPIFIQIPIFYALYKCLMITIEMRHQPFIGWIRDLSAPDPANLMALAHSAGLTWFPAFLGIGLLSALLGLTMYLQFKLNPAPADPVQQQVFSVLPWVMMFMMAPFAAGLQLYWVVSNTLTILQQKWLYSKHPALKEPVKK
jgi:YidC/Oxa1 family membrane protein insertase